MMIKYLCEFRYGAPTVTEVEYLGETALNHRVKKTREILGYSYVSTMQRKAYFEAGRNYALIDGLPDALDWAEKKATEYRRDIEVQHSQTMSKIAGARDRMTDALP